MVLVPEGKPLIVLMNTANNVLVIVDDPEVPKLTEENDEVDIKAMATSRAVDCSMWTHLR